MANKLLVRHCEKQNICASWQLSCLFTLHHRLYLREFCQRSHRECVLSPFGCCLLSAAPFSLDRYDFTVHTRVSSGPPISALLHLQWLVAITFLLIAEQSFANISLLLWWPNPPAVLKPAWGEKKKSNISAKEKVVSVLNWDAMFASCTSQPVCRFCLRGIKIKMLYVFYVLWIMHGGRQQAGRQPSYTVPLLVPSMQTVNDQRGCVIQIIISNDMVFLTSTLKCRPRGRWTPNDNILVHLRTEQNFPSGPRFRIKFSFRRVDCHIN